MKTVQRNINILNQKFDEKKAQSAVLSDAQRRIFSTPCNFFPITWASSMLTLSPVVMKQCDCFWKTISPFFKYIYANSLLIFDSVHCKFFLLLLTELFDAPACWWPCRCRKCASGLRRLEKI